jgi:hypothetical protein
VPRLHRPVFPAYTGVLKTILLTAASVAALLLIPGCDQSGRVADALKNEPNAAAFEKLFPGSDHFINHVGGNINQPQWNSRALLHERYIVYMRFRITSNSGGVTAVGTPEFGVSEVSAVNVTGTLVNTQFAPDSYKKFGPAEWRQLVASNGDLSVLGITPKTNQPVANLKGNWRNH